MSEASTSYELERDDYAWALGALDDPGMSRGLVGAADRVIRAEEKLFRFGPALLIGVLLAAATVFSAVRFGLFSPITLVATALVPIAPIVWIIGAWIYERFEMFGVDGSPAQAIAGTVMKKLDRGQMPLPMGRVNANWDENAIRVTGGSHSVEVPWSSRPAVRRAGDRVMVMPFMAKMGVPDPSRLAIVRADAFADQGAFEQAVEDWTAYAAG